MPSKLPSGGDKSNWAVSRVKDTDALTQPDEMGHRDAFVIELGKLKS